MSLLLGLLSGESTEMEATLLIQNQISATIQLKRESKATKLSVVETQIELMNTSRVQIEEPLVQNLLLTKRLRP